MRGMSAWTTGIESVFEAAFTATSEEEYNPLNVQGQGVAGLRLLTASRKNDGQPRGLLELTPMTRPILIRIEKALSWETLRERSQAAVRAGFCGIEYVISDAAPADRPTGVGAGEIAQDESPCAGLPVRAVAARCTATDVTSAVENVSHLLLHAKALGAACLNLTIPPVAGSGREPGFARYQEGLQFAYELLHRVRFEAEASGVAVALEAPSAGCLLSPVELREIIDAANSWAVGAVIDLRRLAPLSSPADWLTTLKHRVHGVRLDDTASPPATDSPASITVAVFEKVGAALDEIHYVGPVIASVCGDLAEARRRFARLESPNQSGSVMVTGPSTEPD